MKTTATNRKIREFLTLLREGKLDPRPEFQRRLVWTNKDKCRFLETVLGEYPFPEVYVAAGQVDVNTGEANELLVDGQQRITTLYQYFTGSEDLKLTNGIVSYSSLSDEQKTAFLQYDVVVRDLGNLNIEQIKTVFRKINSTSYSLNAMEMHNARYDGEYKRFCEGMVQNPFFENYHVFTPSDIRRMQDTIWMLTFVTTVLSTYFTRDNEVEIFLDKYNDEFPYSKVLSANIQTVLDFVTLMNFSERSQVWKKANLFTLLVELFWILIREKIDLHPVNVAGRLNEFYNNLEAFSENKIIAGSAISETQVKSYFLATQQATNDRKSRITRGEILKQVITEA